MTAALSPQVRTSPATALLLASLALSLPAGAQSRSRPALTPADIDDIARLEMLEDYRKFDSTELTRLLSSRPAEVRRRAAVTVGRLNDKRGIALIVSRPLDKDTAVAASEVFAIGQLRDSSTVP